MTRTRSLLTGLLLLAAWLMADARVAAQAWRAGYAYNPYTGARAGGRAGYNPYTGRAGVSRSGYNPYTGRAGRSGAVYNPYTGRYAAGRAVYNPYTGRSAYRYRTGRR